MTCVVINTGGRGKVSSRALNSTTLILTLLHDASRLWTLHGLVLRSTEGRAENRHPVAGIANEIDGVVLAGNLTPELIWKPQRRLLIKQSSLAASRAKCSYVHATTTLHEVYFISKRPGSSCRFVALSHKRDGREEERRKTFQLLGLCDKS